MEIDPKTGLPVEAIAWEDLAKSEQKITVRTEKRRYGKVITIVSGFDKGIDVKGTAKALKAALACGGTVKDGNIELQGEHKRQVRPVLVKLGFSDDSIDDS
ncbi:stress response translation initiation inhibitor YciH [Candidatus Pacearchaeota archaeon CG10_big_fil_rev_8_21_14_0_10_34_76]|nr:MAG: stress response translation initiation inhibitor YciH [Candidatus Pacearchaeota archaeon CG10_big_fil_rev_8_21_14_0_10_34_76]